MAGQMGQKLLLNVCAKVQQHTEFVFQKRVGKARNQPVLPPSQRMLTTTAGGRAMDKAACGHGGKGEVLHGRVGPGLTLALGLTTGNPRGAVETMPNLEGYKSDNKRRLVYYHYTQRR